MSATDELRKMLDERGVESWDMQTRGLWFGITGNDHKYEAHEQRDGLLLVEAMSLTPEQAIAATLGGGKLTAEQVSKAVYSYSIHADCADADWQAIADELNATLGSGECKVVASLTDGLTTNEPRKWFKLSCGHAFKLNGLDAPVACPVCGKAVRR